MKTSVHKVILFLFFSFIFTACSTGSRGTGKNKPGVGALTQETASMRSKMISNVSYFIWVGLDETSEDFHGRTVVSFELKNKNKEKELWLDFAGGTIHSININGNHRPDLAEDTDNYDGFKIKFKTKELINNGVNRIELSYSHPFGKDGTGLHRSKDAMNDEVHIYSNLEPFDARKIFPCFDQPDIKATYELTVEAPEQWQVISNTQEREVTSVDGRKSWAFPPSSVFSTYLFALIAGPFHVWKSEANGIPMRLFARKSISKFVDYNDWFNTTRKGIQFYSQEFGYPFPYTKYDQIIVPDYNHGAMENVGAVTFNEDRYVFKTKVPETLIKSRQNVILHELAHMWFGNLVTMKWWNGLWLNESFATFMAALATEKALHDPTAIQSQYDEKSGWAYWEDQLSTTHPIDIPIDSTDETRNAFDGITYAKGAAVLKQLRFYLGEEDFKEGIQRYFMKYALKNTTLSQFLKMLSEGSGKNLTQWRKDWLQSAGINTIQASWTCEETLPAGKSKISKLKLTQTGSESYPQPRAHKTLIGLFYFKNGKIETSPSPIEAVYSQTENEITAAIGKDCPDFILPNYKDYDYVKIQFDQKSLKFIQEHLSQFKDALDRQMLWYTLWEMTREGKFKTQDFIDAALTHAKNEKDSFILSSLSSRIARAEITGLSAPLFLTGQTRLEYQEKIEKFIYQLLMKSTPGSDIQTVLFQAFLNSTQSSKQVELLKKVYKGALLLPGIKIDQEKRWDILAAIARSNDPQTLEWIEEEKKKDPSDSGQVNAMIAEAAIPKDETKKKWVSILNRTPSTGIELPPLPKIMSVMRHYNLINQEIYTQNSVEPYFNTLTQLASNLKLEDETYASYFTERMYPLLCEKTNLDRIKTLFEKISAIPPLLSKRLIMHRHREEYCIKARALAEQGSDPTPSHESGAPQTSTEAQTQH